MNFNKAFNAVKEEFSEEIALVVTQMLTIHLSLFPTKKELATPGKLYEDRVIKTIGDVLWEEKQEIFDIALKIWKVFYEWEISNDFDGIGGCKKKTFKELIEIQ